MSSRHLSNLMAANWREPPEARGPMGNVILMTLDILPQAQSYEEFGTRSKDIPPFKILFLIDNWSSKILDFELADSPSQVSTQIAARAYLGMIERHQSTFAVDFTNIADMLDSDSFSSSSRH